MTQHKNWSRSQLIIDHANAVTKGRKLGRVQEAVLKALLEMGTYPGTWKWQSKNVTARTLEALHARGLVQVQEVDQTDVRGDPDPHGQKVTFYRPAQWMLDAMNAPSDAAAAYVLTESVYP